MRGHSEAMRQRMEQHRATISSLQEGIGMIERGDIDIGERDRQGNFRSTGAETIANYRETISQLQPMVDAWDQADGDMDKFWDLFTRP